MPSERFKRAVEKANKEREERDFRIWMGTATEEEKAAQKRESTYTGYTTGGYWKGSKKKANQPADTTEKQIERNQKRLENARKKNEGYGSGSNKSLSGQMTDKIRKKLQTAFKGR